MALIDKLNNLGDAVRERSGLDNKMTLEQMSDVVRNIPQPDLSPYATIEYVDEAVANIDIPDVDLSAYSTTEEMNEAIANSRYNVGQGLAYNPQNNMIGIRLMNSGRLVLNNGALDVRQEGLFTAQNNKIIFEEVVDNAPIVAGVNTLYEFEPDIPLEEFHAFMNQMLQQPQQLMITLRMGQQMGFSNTVVPQMLV
jgi:hypothetical protein